MWCLRKEKKNQQQQKRHLPLGRVGPLPLVAEVAGLQGLVQLGLTILIFERAVG
jgi:hypothetical protein